VLVWWVMLLRHWGQLFSGEGDAAYVGLLILTLHTGAGVVLLHLLAWMLIGAEVVTVWPGGVRQRKSAWFFRSVNEFHESRVKSVRLETLRVDGGALPFWLRPPWPRRWHEHGREVLYLVADHREVGLLSAVEDRATLAEAGARISERLGMELTLVSGGDDAS